MIDIYQCEHEGKSAVAVNKLAAHKLYAVCISWERWMARDMGPETGHIGRRKRDRNGPGTST